MSSDSNPLFFYLIIIFALLVALGFVLKKSLKKCLNDLFFNSNLSQIHQPVALENMSNDFDLKQTDLKLEEVCSFDKQDEENNEKIDMNFENIASDINTAKDSKTSESPKDTQKIVINFSRVEDVSNIMGTDC